MREFESQGLWFLPKKPKDPVAGVLRYSIRDGLQLSLTGTLVEDFGQFAGSYPLIHGLVADNELGRFATLADCFQTRSTLAIPGFASEQIRCNRAYLGSFFLTEEQKPQFLSAEATFAHLAHWSGLTGFKGLLAQRLSPEIITAQYQKPAPLDLTVEQGRRVRVEVDAVAIQGQRQLAIKEKVVLTLSGDLRFSPLEELRSTIAPLEDFLTFAVDRPSPAEEIIFKAESTGSARREERVHFLYQPVFQPREEPKTLGVSDMLFTWEDIQSSHPELPARWFHFRRSFEAACDTYFGFLYAPPAYLETKLLVLYVALGLFLVDRRRDGAIQNVTTASKYMTSPPRDATWSNILASAEELSLPWTAFAFIQDYEDLLVPALGADGEKFVTSLLRTRHRLFHKPDVPDGRRPREQQLLDLVARMGLLIKVRILECLGLSRDEISGWLSDNRWYVALVAGASSRND